MVGQNVSLSILLEEDSGKELLDKTTLPILTNHESDTIKDQRLSLGKAMNAHIP